jgi:hypothetical protein
MMLVLPLPLIAGAKGGAKMILSPAARSVIALATLVVIGTPIQFVSLYCLLKQVDVVGLRSLRAQVWFVAKFRFLACRYFAISEQVISAQDEYNMKK